MPGDELVVSVVMPCLNEAETLDRCIVAARDALNAAGIPGDWVGNAPHGVALPYHYFSRASWDTTVSAARLRETERGDVPALYPFPFSLVFGGRLHFVARLQPSR